MNNKQDEEMYDLFFITQHSRKKNHRSRCNFPRVYLMQMMK